MHFCALVTFVDELKWKQTQRKFDIAITRVGISIHLIDSISCVKLDLLILNFTWNHRNWDVDECFSFNTSIAKHLITLMPSGSSTYWWMNEGREECGWDVSQCNVTLCNWRPSLSIIRGCAYCMEHTRTRTQIKCTINAHWSGGVPTASLWSQIAPIVYVNLNH